MQINWSTLHDNRLTIRVSGVWRGAALEDLLEDQTMGYRRLTDRDGETWEVRDQSVSVWRFEPVGGNPADPVDAQAPGYQKDPFELSQEELQRMLDQGQSVGGSRGTGWQRPKKKSPFLDD